MFRVVGLIIAVVVVLALVWAAMAFRGDPEQAESPAAAVDATADEIVQPDEEPVPAPAETASIEELDDQAGADQVAITELSQPVDPTTPVAGTTAPPAPAAGAPDQVAATEMPQPLEPAPEFGQPTPAAGAARFVAGDSVRMRSAPSLDGEILAVLDRGEQLQAGRVEGDWTEVTTADGRTGWMASQFLSGGTAPIAGASPQ